MPPKQPIELTPAEKDKFADWLDQECHKDMLKAKGLDELGASRLVRRYEIMGTVKAITAKHLRDSVKTVMSSN